MFYSKNETELRVHGNDQLLLYYSLAYKCRYFSLVLVLLLLTNSCGMANGIINIIKE